MAGCVMIFAWVHKCNQYLFSVRHLEFFYVCFDGFQHVLMKALLLCGESATNPRKWGKTNDVQYWHLSYFQSECEWSALAHVNIVLLKINAMMSMLRGISRRFKSSTKIMGNLKNSCIAAEFLQGKWSIRNNTSMSLDVCNTIIET